LSKAVKSCRSFFSKEVNEVMDDIINKVLDIEDQAEKLIEDTKKDEENLRGIYAEKIENMRQDIEVRSDTRIKELDALEELEGAKVCASIEKSSKQSIEKMQNLYQQKKNEWIEVIYQNVIGR